MKRCHKFKGEVGKIYGRVFEGGKARANFNDYIIISKRGKKNEFTFTARILGIIMTILFDFSF